MKVHNEWRGKLRLVVFAHFCGVNAPAMPISSHQQFNNQLTKFPKSYVLALTSQRACLHTIENGRALEEFLGGSEQGKMPTAITAIHHSLEAPGNERGHD